MNALIGSGFFAADADDFDKKRAFQIEYWLPNVGGRDVVIVDNTEPPTQKLCELLTLPNVRVIPVLKNLGHIGQHLDQYRPHLLGWSLSWILPALVAYSENRHFCYFEQDALAFGDWEQSIFDEMEKRELKMAFGQPSPVAVCEQSVFAIKHDFITEAIFKYMAIASGDGIRSTVPEIKFKMMMDNDFRIGMFSLPGGRCRPLPMEEKTFYGQKFTREELEQLKVMGLI